MRSAPSSRPRRARCRPPPREARLRPRWGQTPPSPCLTSRPRWRRGSTQNPLRLAGCVISRRSRVDSNVLHMNLNLRSVFVRDICGFITPMHGVHGLATHGLVFLNEMTSLISDIPFNLSEEVKIQLVVSLPQWPNRVPRHTHEHRLRYTS